MNSQQETDNRVLQKMAALLTERAQCYEVGFQTSALCEKDGQWRNLVTHISFIQKGRLPPESITHEYPGVIVARRLIRPDEGVAVLRGLVEESKLATGTRLESVPLEGHFQSGTGSRNRYAWREWTDWPSEVFRLEPAAEEFRVRDGHALGPLAAPDAPFYPRPELILRDVFGNKSTLNGWPSGLEGTVVLTLPDFRARIVKLVLTMDCLRIELEHPYLDAADIVLKVYAEGVAGLLAQKSIGEPHGIERMELPGKCVRASVAILCRSSGEMLDDKHFQDGAPWTEEGIVLETVKSEIEQMLVAGEGETLEFKERLDSDSVKEGIAKTVVAFANTNGGTVVFGVTDDLRVVGCDDVRRLADCVTGVLRSRCDMVPVFSTEIIKYEDKELLLLHVQRSEGPIYTVRERGPFIRANASNRAPSSLELEKFRGADSSLNLLRS
jgi:hypothetical protein